MSYDWLQNPNDPRKSSAESWCLISLKFLEEKIAQLILVPISLTFLFHLKLHEVELISHTLE